MQVTGIERDFGGEVRRFDLSPIGAWRAVESRCGVGIGRVFARLWSCMARDVDGRVNPAVFEFTGDDIREVLLQGLKGAGMQDAEASKLVRLYFDQADGKAQFATLAVEIVSAFWLGMPEGKTKAPQTDSETAPPATASTSAPYTEPAQP